jgi:uncharacterized protein involved in exopolysaccharide biosynthesis
MSLSSVDTPPLRRTEPADDIIDLRRYAQVVSSWWKEIALVALLTALIAGGAYWLLASTRVPVYSASADVALVRTVSEVTFDERFTTQPESLPATSLVSRRAALLALANQPALALDVIAEMGDTLPDELRTPAALARVVTVALGTSATLRADSDLIRITATTVSPELSAQVATAWARAYVRTVNQIYGQVPDNMLESIQQEQAAAQATYATAQSRIEQFRARSHIDELTRQIADVEQMLNSLRRGRQTVFGSLVTRSIEGRDAVAQAVNQAQAATLAAPYVREQEGRRAIINAAMDALYQGQAQVIAEQARRDQELLAGHYTRWVQMTRSRQEAEALRAQVAALSEETAPGSSVLVLSLLKLQALTQALDPQAPPQLSLTAQPSVDVTAQASESTSASAAPGMIQSMQPVQVQVGVTPLQLQLDDRATVSQAALLEDIDALTAALTDGLAALETEIGTLSEQILSGTGYDYVAGTVSDDSALAQAIQAQTGAIMNGTILTNTAVAAPTVNGQYAALFHLDDLEALVSSTSENQPLVATIAAMEEQVRSLKANLEAQRAEETRLLQERDLALESLRAVSSKIAELSLSRAAGSSEVRFAAPAVPPSDPIGGLSVALVVAAAAVAGLFLGVVVAFVADSVGGQPFLWRRQASTRPV